MTNSITRRQNAQKAELLEKLRETPVVEVACRKIGIARSTYYRWRKDSEEFTAIADGVIHEGKLFINDMAESQLISEIKEKNMTAIIFWLKHNHPSFSTRVEIIPGKKEEELSQEQKDLLGKALELGALIPGKDGEEKNG